MIPYKDRRQAGSFLAEKLNEKIRPGNACILALPRGGVPVAWEVARKLRLPLDVLAVKKIGAPDNPEFAIGALAENQRPVWNQEAIRELGVPRHALRTLADAVQEQIRRQTARWRAGNAPLPVKDRTVILVDDGVATGTTMSSAIELLRRQGARRIVAAAPVGPVSAVSYLKLQADEMVILQTPQPFFSVGQWYENFDAVSDETVTRLLTGQKKICSCPLPPSHVLPPPNSSRSAVKRNFRAPEGKRHR